MLTGILLRKLAFVFSCALAGVVLLLVAISAATIDTSSGFSSLPEAVQENVSHVGQTVGDSLGAVAASFEHTAAFIDRATDVHALIRPADYMEVPVITASATILSVPTAPVPPAATIATPTPAPTPPKILTTTANLYAPGNCTWWVAARRAEIGNPIPNSWGNAATWASRAARDGYLIDHQPAMGAIMQTANSAKGLGHVAFVESVDSDGTWHISEMNVRGLGVVDRKPLPPAAAVSYNFIH